MQPSPVRHLQGQPALPCPLQHLPQTISQHLVILHHVAAPKHTCSCISSALHSVALAHPHCEADTAFCSILQYSARNPVFLTHTHPSPVRHLQRQPALPRPLQHLPQTISQHFIIFHHVAAPKDAMHGGVLDQQQVGRHLRHITMQQSAMQGFPSATVVPVLCVVMIHGLLITSCWHDMMLLLPELQSRLLHHTTRHFKKTKTPKATPCTDRMRVWTEA